MQAPVMTSEPILALTLQYGGVKMGVVHTLKEWDAIMGDTKASAIATLEQMLRHYEIETGTTLAVNPAPSWPRPKPLTKP